MRSRVAWVSGALLALSLQGTVAQISSPIHECDRLAADPLDAARVASPAATLNQTNAAAAIAACQTAAVAYPGAGRFHYQLARALHAMEELDAAIESVERALDLEYPAAAALLADFYVDLIVSTFDRKDDLERATALYAIAKAKGYAVPVEKELAAWEEYYSLAFVSEGYRAAALMQAIWEEKPVPAERGERGFEFLSFMFSFNEVCVENPNREDDFTAWVSQAIADRLAGLSGSEIHPLVQLLASQVAGGALGPAAMSYLRGASHDAILFINRHGCESDISREFLSKAWAAFTALMADKKNYDGMLQHLLEKAAYFLDTHKEQFPEGNIFVLPADEP